MPIFHAIAAMSENRAIGKDGRIPWRISDDFRWFKHKTMGGTLIMGRKTRESIGRSLPGRTNLVLTRHPVSFEETRCFADVESLRTFLLKEGIVWVAGGAEIYRQFLPLCTFLYLSRIKRVVEGDVFFPNFEDGYSLDQVIHENADFRVERWLRHSATGAPPEAWPF